MPLVEASEALLAMHSLVGKTVRASTTRPLPDDPTG